MRPSGLAGSFGDTPSLPQLVLYAGAGIAVPAAFIGTHAPGPAIYPRYGAAMAASVFTIAANNGRLQSADSMTFTSTGALPAPLVAGKLYYKVNSADGAAATTFQVAEAAGGPPLALTGGSGTHTVQLRMTDNSPTDQVDVVRTLSNTGTFWAAVHTADGVFDWTLLDDYIPWHYAQGHKLLYTLYQTPSWNSNDTVVDQYGAVGGAGCPGAAGAVDTTKAVAFGTALFSRYNAVSAVNPTGARMIPYFEGWNEPSGKARNSSNSYFNSPDATAANAWPALAKLQRALSLGIKAVDAGVLCLSPGFTAGNLSNPLASNDAYRFLNASDGASGTGKDWCDGVAVHTYNFELPTSLHALPQYVSGFRAVLMAAGMASNVPLWATEQGLICPDGYTDDDRARYLATSIVAAAALGFQAHCHFTWAGWVPVGRTAAASVSPHITPAVRAKLKWLRSVLCGKTLTYAALDQPGAARGVPSCTFTVNGSTYQT